MQLFKTLLAVAALASSAAAQAVLAFTTTPGSVTAGVPTTIRWTGGNGSPVTITLKKGDPNDLKTISVLTGDATGNSFTWTPSSSLANGKDYALSISQGINTVNYSGLFSLSGGGSGVSSALSSASSSLSSAVSSASSVLSSLGSSLSSSASSSASASASSSYITSAPVLTAPSASGTGSTISRNTTFSSATLSSASLTSIASLTSSASSRASSAGAGASSTAGAAVGMQMQGAIGAGALAAVLFAL